MGGILNLIRACTDELEGCIVLCVTHTRTRERGRVGGVPVRLNPFKYSQLNVKCEWCIPSIFHKCVKPFNLIYLSLSLECK